MFKDDPQAEEYDKYGKYYPRETLVYQSTSIGDIPQMMDSINRGEWDLFHRNTRKKRLEQLRRMKLKKFCLNNDGS
tara:strand:+ start:3618 stop:3845 length:228 start_codon:yes stop_codon:yes gene_type:complete